MTVSSETNKSQLLVYTSGTDMYSWGSFEIPADADALVYVFDDSGNGDRSILTLATHYTVDTASKEITITTAGHAFIAGLGYTNERLAVYRSIDSLLQSNEYTNQGAFLSQTIEDSFDGLYYIVQEHSEILKRTLQIDPFDTVIDGYSTEEEQRQAVTLPSLDGVDGGIIYFDSTLQQFVLSGNSAINDLNTVASVSSSVVTVAADLDGADTIGTVAADLSGSNTIGAATSLILAGSPGFISVASAGTANVRSITAPADGLSVTNGDGASGNPVIAPADDLAALEGLSSTGIAVRTGADSWAQRSLATAGNGLSISNSDGVSGNPTFTLDQDLQVSGSPTFAGLTLTGNLDMSGNDIILDADNDTKVVVNGDDSVSVSVGGTEVLKLDGAAADKLILDGVSLSPTGAAVGQALGYPNSASTLEPYTPLGAGDLLSTANLSELTDPAAAKTNLRVFVANITALQALNGADLTDGEVIGVRGYTTAGDGGQRFVVYDSGSSATDNAVTVFTPADATGRFIHQGIVFPEHAGMSEGTADNATELTRLLDANVNFNGRGRLYPLTTGVSMPADYTAKIENLELDISSAGDITAITGNGDDFTTVGALTADAGAGTANPKTITVADASSVSAGDIVLVSSDKAWNSETALSSEYAVVASTTSTTVVVENPLKDEYLTTDSAELRLVNTTLSPDIDGLKFIGAGGSSSQVGLLLRRTVGLRMRNVVGIDVRNRTISLVADLFSDIDDTYIDGSDQNGLGYGIAASGGWGSSYGNLSGKRVRHMFTTGDGPSFGSGNTPNYLVTREIRVGDVHVVDAEGALVDCHPGACDIMVGTTSGNMRDGVSEEVVICQGARMTFGDINVTSMEATGVSIQPYGMGDPDRDNFVFVGNVALSSDGIANGNYAIAITNLGTAGEVLDTVKVNGINSRGDRGIIVQPQNGDIDLVELGGGHAYGDNYDVLSVDDNASYRVKRVIARGLKLEAGANATSRYPLYVTANDYNASPDRFTTIVDLYDCELYANADNLVVRNLGRNLIRFWNTRLFRNGTAATDDLTLQSGTEGAWGIDGVIYMQETIATGEATVIPGGVITLNAESGTSDTLTTLNLSPDFFGGNDGSGGTEGSGAAAMDNLPLLAYLRAAPGDTITLQHAGSGANTIHCPYDQNLVLGANQVATIMLLPGTQQFYVVAVSEPDDIRPTTVNLQSGGSYDVNGTQVVGAQIVDANLADTAALTAQTLTDNSGGTASDTIAVISAAYSQTEVANAVASLADEINKLRDDTEAQKTALDAALTLIRTHGLGATS